MPALPFFARVTGFLSLVLIAAALVGCSRPTATVTGKISYNGTPLKGGTVSFHNTEQKESFGGIIEENGTYFVPTIYAGNYKIVVETESIKPRVGGGSMSYKKNTKKDEPAEKPLDPAIKEKVPEGYHPSNPGDAGAARAGKRFVQIPAEYGIAESTKLSYTVVGGAQTYDLELK